MQFSIMCSGFASSNLHSGVDSWVAYYAFWGMDFVAGITSELRRKCIKIQHVMTVKTTRNVLTNSSFVIYCAR